MYCTMFTPERSTSPLEMTPATSITAILLSELVEKRETSSRFRMRSAVTRLRGITLRDNPENPEKLSRRLNTSSTRKTSVSTFQITLDCDRAGGIESGGGGRGVRITGGGGG